MPMGLTEASHLDLPTKIEISSAALRRQTGISPGLDSFLRFKADLARRSPTRNPPREARVEFRKQERTKRNRQSFDCAHPANSFFYVILSFPRHEGGLAAFKYFANMLAYALRQQDAGLIGIFRASVF